MFFFQNKPPIHFLNKNFTDWFITKQLYILVYH